MVACIPAYNEESNLAKVVILAQRHVDKVVVCNDGSIDMTAEIAMKLGATVLEHERNMGYGAALRTIFKEQSSDVLVTLDADGQHDPREIPKLVEPIIKGEADIVVGSRFLGKSKMPKYRKLGVGMITKLSNLNITDAQSGFRAYSRKALEKIMPTEMGMGVSTEILIKATEQGLRIKEVPINIRYDVIKPSHQNPFTHGLEVLLSILKFMSIKRPLLFYGVPGAISLMIALAFWVWTLRIFSETRQIMTNIALIAIGTTMVGLMLLTTAIILYV
ncbi:MAG: glycosyltransferase family 2 protein, partial [archaeon]|nr:glycosyltransferase family 2 protein [archaeon]